MSTPPAPPKWVATIRAAMRGGASADDRIAGLSALAEAEGALSRAEERERALRYHLSRIVALLDADYREEALRIARAALSPGGETE